VAQNNQRGFEGRENITSHHLHAMTSFNVINTHAENQFFMCKVIFV